MASASFRHTSWVGVAPALVYSASVDAWPLGHVTPVAELALTTSRSWFAASPHDQSTACSVWVWSASRG